MTHLPRGYEHKRCGECGPDVTVRVASAQPDRYWIFRARRCQGLVVDFNMILMHRAPTGDQQVMRLCSRHGALHVHGREPGKRKGERLLVEAFDSGADLDEAFQSLAVGLPEMTAEMLHRMGWLR